MSGFESRVHEIIGKFASKHLKTSACHGFLFYYQLNLRFKKIQNSSQASSSRPATASTNSKLDVTKSPKSPQNRRRSSFFGFGKGKNPNAKPPEKSEGNVLYTTYILKVQKNNIFTQTRGIKFDKSCFLLVDTDPNTRKTCFVKNVWFKSWQKHEKV